MLERFVVTGSGRCGTKYLARLLTAAGVSCTHEQAFNADGAGQWQTDQVADSSWMAATMLEKVDVPVVLLVRHPLAVVKSWVEIGFFTHDLMNPTHAPLTRFAPLVYEWDQPADRALAMWLELNCAALGRAELVLRLEQLDIHQLTRLVRWAGADSDLAPVRYAFKNVDRCNRHQVMRDRTGVQHQPGWAKHNPGLAIQAIAMAEALGYDTRQDPA